MNNPAVKVNLTDKVVNKSDSFLDDLIKFWEDLLEGKQPSLPFCAHELMWTWSQAHGSHKVVELLKKWKEARNE